MTPSPNGRSITEAMDEVQRELQVRKRCFPRWVAEGRVSKSDAKDREERQEAALWYLQELCLAQSKVEACNEVAAAGDKGGASFAPTPY